MFTYDGEVPFYEAVATTLNNIHSCNLNVFLVHCLIKNNNQSRGLQILNGRDVWDVVISYQLVICCQLLPSTQHQEQ